MSKVTEHKQDVAVALKYDGYNTPTITAKGEHEIARRILEIADEENIPLKHDPELAAILSQIPLGQEIPENLYRAVAEVIAFAFFLAGKTPEGWKTNYGQDDGNTPYADQAEPGES